MHKLERWSENKYFGQADSFKNIPRHLKLIESEKKMFLFGSDWRDLVKAKNVRQTIFRVYNNPDAFYKVKRSTKWTEEDDKVANYLNDVNQSFPKWSFEFLYKKSFNLQIFCNLFPKMEFIFKWTIILDDKIEFFLLVVI